MSSTHSSILRRYNNPLDWVLFLLAVAMGFYFKSFWIPLVYIIGRTIITWYQRRLIITDKVFQHHGIRVDFEEKTICVEGYTYTIDQITSFSVGEDVKESLFLKRNTVEIRVDDFKKPVHRLTFPGGKSSEFQQRFLLALRKGGWNG